MASQRDAIAQLEKYAALTAADAKSVVDAVVAAAQEEAVDQIANDALVPTSVADARVVRLARICGHLGRLLSQTEVEVLLRVPPSTARSTLNRLRAGYRQEAAEWATRIVTEQVESVVDATTQDAGPRWRITFNDPAAIDYAVAVLRREGMTRGIAVNMAKQTLILPQTMRDRQGKPRKSREVLGV